MNPTDRQTLLRHIEDRLANFVGDPLDEQAAAEAITDALVGLEADGAVSSYRVVVRPGGVVSVAIALPADNPPLTPHMAGGHQTR